MTIPPSLARVLIVASMMVVAQSVGAQASATDSAAVLAAAQTLLRSINTF